MSLDKIIFPHPKATYTEDSIKDKDDNCSIQYLESPCLKQPREVNNVPVLAMGYQIYEDSCDIYVLYFHGNAEDLGGAMKLLRQISDSLRVNIIAVEYPSYGIYNKKVSAEQIKIDALSVYDRLIESGISPQKIIVFGRSIGTGPACEIGAKRKPGGIILLSAFTSIKKLSGEITFSLFSHFIKERFSNLECVQRFSSPCQLIHGQSDKVISFQHSKQLQQVMQENGNLVVAHYPEKMTHSAFNFDRDIVKPIKKFLTMIQFPRVKIKAIQLPILFQHSIRFQLLKIKQNQKNNNKMGNKNESSSSNNDNNDDGLKNEQNKDQSYNFRYYLSNDIKNKNMIIINKNNIENDNIKNESNNDQNEIQYNEKDLQSQISECEIYDKDKIIKLQQAQQITQNNNLQQDNQEELNIDIKGLNQTNNNNNQKINSDRKQIEEFKQIQDLKIIHDDIDQNDCNMDDCENSNDDGDDDDDNDYHINFEDDQYNDEDDDQFNHDNILNFNLDQRNVDNNHDDEEEEKDIDYLYKNKDIVNNQNGQNNIDNTNNNVIENNNNNDDFDKKIEFIQKSTTATITTTLIENNSKNKKNNNDNNELNQKNSNNQENQNKSQEKNKIEYQKHIVEQDISQTHKQSNEIIILN